MTASSRRLIAAATAVLWGQAALLVCAGTAMVGYGLTATGAAERVGVAMMFLALYPLLLAVAAVALAGALRRRRPSARGGAIGYEAFLLVLTAPFVNYPFAGIAAAGSLSVLASAFVLAVTAARPGARMTSTSTGSTQAVPRRNARERA